MLRISPAFTVPVALVCLSVPAAVYADVAADRATLLSGVSEIAAPGIPGGVSIVGANAFPVVVGKDNNQLAPVVGAGYLGKGRVVAFGHDGYFAAEALKFGDTGKLVVNSVRWAAGSKASPRIGVLEPWAGARAFLEAQGFTVVSLSEQNGSTNLKNVDVVVGVLSNLPVSERPAYRAFLERGGGLVIAETGWGWKQVHDDAPISTIGTHAIISGSGVLFSDAMLDRSSAKGFTTATAIPDTLNAFRAVELVKSGKLTPAETKQAVATVSTAMNSLPANDNTLLPALRKLGESSTSDFTTITTNPIKTDSAADRLAMTFQVRQAMSLPPEQVRALPTAKAFPGAVPAEAPRVTKTVTINGDRGARESTGYYAAPGELVTVTVPQSIVGKGFLVRVGAHTDTLWHLDTWKRAPQISRAFPIDKTTVKVANAFGGTIYIDVPGNQKFGDFSVTVAGAVAQPRFVRGKTTTDAWKTIRNAPAPWAELEGDRCMITVPSSVVRTLDNPEELMTYWDEVMLKVHELYGVPKLRDRPERYCPDVQISAGYMHSGYPIMTWDDVEKTFVDLAKLRSDGGPTWGFYHEVGHNFQVSDWTWDGCGEVTNNLFSLYGGETFNNVYQNGDYVGAHSAVTPEERTKRMQKFFAEPTFDKWKSDPFLALTIYIELRREFGWEPFKKVFAEYEKLSPNERPKTDLEKHDQFMVRFSRTVGKNLGPLFTKWTIPTSDAARKLIADLPVWMPDDLKPYMSQ